MTGAGGRVNVADLIFSGFGFDWLARANFDLTA